MREGGMASETKTMGGGRKRPERVASATDAAATARAPEAKAVVGSSVSTSPPPSAVPFVPNIDYARAGARRVYMLVAPKAGVFRHSDWEALVQACAAHRNLPRGVYALRRSEGLLAWPSGHEGVNVDHEIRTHRQAPEWNGVATKLTLSGRGDPAFYGCDASYGFGAPRVAPGAADDDVIGQGAVALCDWGHGMPDGDIESGVVGTCRHTARPRTLRGRTKRCDPRRAVWRAWCGWLGTTGLCRRTKGAREWPHHGEKQRTA